MISLYDLLEAANGQLFGEPAAQIFTDFCLDPREAGPNLMYIARKTDAGDTHSAIRDVVARGVAGILCTSPPEVNTEGVSVIIVKDVEDSLMAWARFVLQKLGTRVVAVSGSSGKSVTVAAAERILSSRYRVYATAAPPHGERLRVPLALAQLRAEHQIAIIGLGALQPGSMREMVRALRPEVAVLTQVGQVHSEAFFNLGEIAAEEEQLITALEPDGLAVLNYDDDHVRQMAARSRAPVRTIGITNFGADLIAYNVVDGVTKTGFDLRYGAERYVGRWMQLLGRQHLYCALSALAVGLHFDVSLDDGLRALADLPPLSGRMRPLIGVNGALLIDDSYEATLDSALAALDWLHAVRGAGGRVVLVLGDIGHGANNRADHREVGRRAAEVVDYLVTEGAEAALAGRAALDQGMDRHHVAITYSDQDVLTAVLDTIRPGEGDVVLFKAGSESRLERLVRPLLADSTDAQHVLVRDETAFGELMPIWTTWVEIDKNALAHNVRLLKARLGPDVRLMAVVKANAYGHGAVLTAATALANGAEALAVASLQEALELRDAGIEAPILILSYVPVHAARLAIRHDLTLTLYDLDMAHGYHQVAREMHRKLRVHVKIDTGMGRMGVMARDGVSFFRRLINLTQLDIEGLYTHFSMSDEDPNYTLEQLRVFKSVLNPLRAAGFNFRYVHTANSAAALTLPETYFNLVRVGVAMFGLSPSDVVTIPPEFRPVMSWKTVIAQVKTLPPGHPVGYGQSYHTQGEERIAVIPVGYAYGFRRKPHNWGQVLVRGQVAPIVGRVSMEKTTINVTHIPDVAIGDEVVLLGRQGEAHITAEMVGEQLGTNNYEVVCNILARMPRR